MMTISGMKKSMIEYPIDDLNDDDIGDEEEYD